MNKLLDFNSSLCLKVLNQMKIDQQDLQSQTLDEFKLSNQNKYNMDESAWELFWESSEEQKQFQIQNIQKAIQEEQIKEEKNKQTSYCRLINNLISDKSILQEKKKLEGLNQGKLKDLRYFVEQQICELTKEKKFTCRYKQINEKKDDQQKIELNQQINDKQLNKNIKDKQIKNKNEIKRTLKQTKKQINSNNNKQKKVNFNLLNEKDYPDQIINLDKKHLLEIHMMLKQEEFEEMNRNTQQQINYNQERAQSKQEIQRLITQQNKELNYLIKAYNF